MAARASAGEAGPTRRTTRASANARRRASARVRSIADSASENGSSTKRRAQMARRAAAASELAQDAAELAFSSGASLTMENRLVMSRITANDEEEEDGLVHVYKTSKWFEIRDQVRPTQVALGWDWTFLKLANFKDYHTAAEYMSRKPVPFVSYRGKRYVVDHHHTLAALELSGWDVEVKMEEIFEYDADLTEERFWGIMEGKGWSFCWDADYKRMEYSDIPKSFNLTAFRNDVYRSLGGFARRYKLLKRGKMLEDKLFFEFQWGYFFWLHRNDAYALWPSSQLQRGFDRLLKMIEQTDDSEYIGEGHLEAARDVQDMILLSEKVLQPLYEVLVEYIAPLAYAYQTIPLDEERVVPGLKKRFGREYLPGSVITGTFDFMESRQKFALPPQIVAKKDDTNASKKDDASASTSKKDKKEEKKDKKEEKEEKDKKEEKEEKEEKKEKKN